MTTSTDTTEPRAETATERAAHAVRLAHTLSSAQSAALRIAFVDDQGTYHLSAAAANTRRALQRKNLVQRGLDTLSDLGRLVRTVLVEGAATVVEDAERQDAGPHAIVINKQRHGVLVSVRFASPDRLDDVLFEMGVPPRYRAGGRVPHDQRGTFEIRDSLYIWLPVTAKPASVTPSTPTPQPSPHHHVAEEGTRQAATVIRTLTPPMRRAVTAIGEDPIAPGVDGRTLEALLNRGIIQDIPGHYFPRFALTDLGLLVRETLDKRAKRNDDEDTETEPQPRSAEKVESSRTAGVDGTAGSRAASSADGRRAGPAALPAGRTVITFAPVPQGARWQVLVTQELSRLYRVTVDHNDLGIDHDPHNSTTLAEAVRARALELFAHGSARAIGGEQSVEVTSWEIEGNRRAAEALEFHTQRVESHADRAGAQDASPLVLDTWSSASRQHYIDTGRYLPAEEAGPDDGDGIRALFSPDDLECALRTLAELRDLGAIDAYSDHLSTRQCAVAERVSTLLANSDV